MQRLHKNIYVNSKTCNHQNNGSRILLLELGTSYQARQSKKNSKLRNLKSFHLEIWCLKDNVDNFYKNVRLTVAYKYLCGKQQSLNLIKQLVNDL